MARLFGAGSFSKQFVRQYDQFESSRIQTYDKQIGQAGRQRAVGNDAANGKCILQSTVERIVFPAAILQSPFFSKDAETPLNYGGIGAVIGHEISHAFDDQGSKYDGDGNLNNWWTDEDRAAFKELTGRLVAQYADYEPLIGKKVNGNLTLGENIADLSGLSIGSSCLQNVFEW